MKNKFILFAAISGFFVLLSVLSLHTDWQKH
ncbi:Uncharacterised protein [Actinobacillus lignieresii]|uniref:Uncharacterized protein n=1 Tax=Actinobacillus lignieresii TaxID=720 RepID=A0A380TTR4_ACTLI|nr:Uncharacterised protein [Actinobacillus lignieresii]